jgi:Zn-dependent protease with chaperone function
MKYTPRLPERNVNVTPTSPLWEFFVLAGGLLAVVIGLYLVLGLAVDLIVPRISSAVEEKMGSLFLGTMAPGPEHSDATAAAQRILDDLQDRCTHLSYRFRISVHDSPAINALALPGGHIVIFTGLLEKVTSENELSFVLAHELGHYVHRDHLRAVGRALVFMLISTALLGPDNSLSTLLGGALNVTELNFSRKQEIWADAFAIDVLNCAYGHVGGAADFFRKIEKESDPGVFGHYFSTHPRNQERIADLRALARERGYESGELVLLPAVLLNNDNS